MCVVQRQLAALEVDLQSEGWVEIYDAKPQTATA
jgi:hypothetical protein